MTDYIFIPVPISEKPKEEGWYVVISISDRFTYGNNLWYSPKTETWYPESTMITPTVDLHLFTHYLRKVPRQEWESGFAEWASGNGWTYVPVYKAWRYLNTSKEMKTTADLLQTYLETI